MCLQSGFPPSAWLCKGMGDPLLGLFESHWNLLELLRTDRASPWPGLISIKIERRVDNVIGINGWLVDGSRDQLSRSALSHDTLCPWQG